MSSPPAHPAVANLLETVDGLTPLSLQPFLEHLAAIIGGEFRRLHAENIELRAAMDAEANSHKPALDSDLDVASPELPERTLQREASHATQDTIDTMVSRESTGCAPTRNDTTRNDEITVDVNRNNNSVRDGSKRTSRSTEMGTNAARSMDLSVYRSASMVQRDVKDLEDIKEITKQKGVFSNANNMKEMLRLELLNTEVYDVRKFYKTTGVSQRIARSQSFENVTMLAITFYAVWMAIDTDINDAKVITEAHWVFFCMEQFFCAFFFTELAIRFSAFKDKTDCRNDGWFMFDFILVLTMVLETWVLTIIIYMTSPQVGSGLGGNAAILRVARLFRLSRLFRMARLVKLVPELLIMVKAIVAAARSVFFTLCLLGIIVYVFGIAMVQTMRKTNVGEEYFGSVFESANTLVLYGTLLDEISGLMHAVQSESGFGMFLLYVFVALAALTMMNMLIGVLCEVINAVASAEKEAIQVNFVRSTLENLVEGSLVGKNEGDMGQLRKSAFDTLMSEAHTIKTLRALDVDVYTLLDFAEIVFEDKDIEDDEEDGRNSEYEKERAIEFVDFMEMVLQLRGSNSATVKDVVDLRKMMILKFKGIEDKLTSPLSRAKSTFAMRPQRDSNPPQPSMSAFPSYPGSGSKCTSHMSSPSLPVPSADSATATALRGEDTEERRGGKLLKM
jgi:hypothetical protein